MAATTTLSTSLIAKQLARDYPQFSFTLGDACIWSPSTQTIQYTDDSAQLLHELAHALLGHNSFRRDIDLIGLERDAWHYAVDTLAPRYGVAIDTEAVDSAMDTYRVWLHERSLCPTCSATGVQADLSIYHCLMCATNWRVNDARACGLKRIKIK